MNFISVKNISELELLVINTVKKIREDQNISRRELSIKMGLAHSFVGKVESLSFPDKYNIRHLYLIATALKLKSIHELFPSKLPKYDLIRITYTKAPKTNKDGSESKQLEEKVVKIEPV